MALSEVTNTVRDGALNAAPDTIENAIVLFGYATGGTPLEVYTCNNPQDVVDQLTGGPLAEDAAAILDVLGKGPVYAVPVTSDVVGSIGAATKSGAGPTLTPSGTPNDDYEFVVLITKGGALATAEFKYSVDGGDTYSAAIVTAASYVVPGTGVTLGFASGTYVLDETYSFDCVAPGFSTSNLGLAITAFLNSDEEASLGVVVGVPVDAAATAALAVAVEAKAAAAEAEHVYMRWFIECADVADATLNTAMDAVEAKHVVACPGYCEYQSALSSRVYKRSGAWPVAARAAKVKVQRHLGAVADGSLPGVRSLHRDERTATTKMRDHRMCALRTRHRLFYVEKPWTLAAAGSDFATLHNGRVMDKACRLSVLSMEKYLNEDWYLQADGTIAESEAKRIESAVLKDIENGMLPDGNCSAIQFSLSRTDDITATNKINTKTRVQPKGYSEFIENDIGFTKTVTTA